MGIKRGSTLFEAVPALSTRVPQTSGVLKLVPLSASHPYLMLRPGRNLIGRDAEQVDHVVDAHQISRVHCEVNVSSERITIHDLGSHNGTYVNRVAIEDADLALGDEVGVSRAVAYRLVRDQELTSPHLMDLDFDEAEPTMRTGDFSATRMTGEVAHGSAAEPPAADVQAPLTLDELMLERDLAMILYQTALGCLMSESVQERETLLSNVLPRLTEMDAGFILHLSGSDWRACLCPTPQEPSDQLLRGCYRLARAQQRPLALTTTAELALLGMQGGGALVVPLVFNDALIGVVGVVAYLRTFTAEALGIVERFADVCAASLRP